MATSSDRGASSAGASEPGAQREFAVAGRALAWRLTGRTFAFGAGGHAIPVGPACRSARKAHEMGPDDLLPAAPRPDYSDILLRNN